MRALSSVCSAAAILLLASPARGEVVFTAPVSGKAFPANKAFSVTWSDDGNDPKILTSSAFTLDLCTGSNANILPLTTLVAGQTFSTAAGTVPVTVISTLAGPGAFYFLRITWTTADGTVVNYSDRFSVTGMVGTWSPAQLAANGAGDTDRPPAVHPAAAAAKAPDPAAGQYGIPYNQQTGAIKYAPMQPRLVLTAIVGVLRPGSKITAKNMKRLNPTSAYTIFTTKGPQPLATTTITQPITYQQTTVVNEAAPAPMPDDDMAKFLNRWKD
ncbi:hypothetical protein Dda_1721 [Drechslerella dactyloides]|uniref:Uncharacterized protein n=1 Tax=Drechslerella dactyloides TaxID=74499 RepID=A0AAD6J4J4_DREDA|nr:hypothetical protein Dda_1721 [Drechslerella dactyloides]